MNRSKSTFKKLLSLLMCAIFVLSTVSVLASCNKGDDGITSQAGDTEEAKPDIPEVTEANFGGYEFNVLICSRSSRTPNDFEVKEGQADTAMGSAVYTRYLRMLEKYNVNIVCNAQLGGDERKNEAFVTMETQYNSQTNDYDFCVINTYAVAPITTAGYLYDMNSVPYLDLTKSWWDQTMLDDLTISGSVYFMSGDITTTVDDYMYCTIFNKKLYDQYITDGTDVYELVNKKDWTLDKLKTLSSMLKDGDVDGDDIMTNADRYGLMTWYDEMFASVQASGGRIAKVNENGYMELTLQSERNFAVMNKYMELENLPTTINFQNETINPGKRFVSIFSENRAMFFMTILNEVYRFRDQDVDYGILPNPMYNDEQEDWFCTFSAGLASFTCIPGYQQNIERTGIIVELLGWEAVETIKPGYYDHTLNGKLVSDNESIDSLTIILDNKFVDIGHYFTVGSLNQVMHSVASSGSAASFMSEYATYRDQAISDVNRINSEFDALKTRN